jgi:hypothetical protein
MIGILVLVADTKGTAVAGASVIIDDVPTRHVETTDATGQAYFEIGDLPQSHLWIAAAGYQPYSQHLELPTHNVQIRVGVPADPDRDDLILPPLEPQAMPRIQVDGLRFVTDDGRPWVMAFVSSFRLYERFLRGEDIRPVLQETSDVGANGVRVFGMFDFGSPQTQRLYPDEHPDYYAQLRPFFALLAEYRLYAQFTVFADTKRAMPSADRQFQHWGHLFGELADVPNVLLERVNEANAHENGVAADVPRPLGILASNGSNGAGSDPPGPFWDYADLHSERPADLPKLLQSTTTLAFAIHGYPGFSGTQRATVASEPIGFADVDQPGRRVANPDVAYLLGLGCCWGAGGTAHSDCGVQSVLLSPTQRTCVEQFLRGVKE